MVNNYLKQYLFLVSMNDCILLRYGELGLKSKRTRPRLEKNYLRIIKDALKRTGFDDFRIDNFGGRFVLFIADADKTIDVLKRVPGIQSLSPAQTINFSDENDLISKANKLVKNVIVGKTFYIKAKRIGKHKFSSMDITKKLGSKLFNKSKGVDATNPEVKIFLEIRDEKCFLFTKTYTGVGGLPLDTVNKVLCLFSGGIDSPVAAVKMLKRGCKVDFLFVNLVGEKLLRDVSKIYNFLITNYSFGYSPKIFIVDGKALVNKIKKDVPDSIRQIAYKIALYKIGELISKKNDYLCLVGGESLSQKSSQTLKSLLFIEKQADISMLRPLLTFDKIQITVIAKNIGTLSMSEKIKEYCGLSDGPVTTAPDEKCLKKIPSFEKEIDFAVTNMNVIKGLILLDTSEKTDIPKINNVIGVDIRSEIIQKKIPLKTDKQIPYSEVIDRLDEFSKEKSYVLICEFGVRGEDIASELRSKGIKAAGVDMEDYVKYFLKK